MDTTQAFAITYKGQQIDVTPESDKLFKVNVDGSQLTIEKRQDNEGGDHWFEQGSDESSAQAKEIGELIAKQIMEEKTK